MSSQCVKNLDNVMTNKVLIGICFNKLNDDKQK